MRESGVTTNVFLMRIKQRLFIVMKTKLLLSRRAFTDKGILGLR